MKYVKDEVKGLARSFVYAFHGIRFCITNERNMRIHLTVLALVFYFSVIYGLERQEWIVLILTSAMVLVCEMINTAIEALVNLETTSYHNIARIAKDVAAGAVFLTAVASVIVGVILFIQPERLIKCLERILEYPVLILPFLLLLVLGIWFIIFGSKLKRKH